jgi:superfamily II DNA or RNA helicase
LIAGILGNVDPGIDTRRRKVQMIGRNEVEKFRNHYKEQSKQSMIARIDDEIKRRIQDGWDEESKILIDVSDYVHPDELAECYKQAGWKATVTYSTSIPLKPSGSLDHSKSKQTYILCLS